MSNRKLHKKLADAMVVIYPRAIKKYFRHEEYGISSENKFSQEFSEIFSAYYEVLRDTVIGLKPKQLLKVVLAADENSGFEVGDPNEEELFSVKVNADDMATETPGLRLLRRSAMMVLDWELSERYFGR
jgi:hypothetical protein